VSAIGATQVFKGTREAQKTRKSKGLSGFLLSEVI